MQWQGEKNILLIGQDLMTSTTNNVRWNIEMLNTNRTLMMMQKKSIKMNQEISTIQQTLLILYSSSIVHLNFVSTILKLEKLSFLFWRSRPTKTPSAQPKHHPPKQPTSFSFAFQLVDFWWHHLFTFLLRHSDILPQCFWFTESVKISPVDIRVHLDRTKTLEDWCAQYKKTRKMWKPNCDLFLIFL